jgi:nitrite reductase/ring-hydroxylating ferredoxin subunit/uncharacterized membrane protein
MINRLIHGAPFRHPLHPALVHYPIGLFTLGVFFDLLSLLQGDPGWLYFASLYTIGGGILMGLLTAVPGLVDWSEIRSDHPGKQQATTHMILNFTAVALFAASFFLRLDQQVVLFGDYSLTVPNQEVVPIFPFILALVGLTVTFISGYLGGKLVYDQGIGVGRYRRPTKLPSHTIQAGAAQAKGGFIPVANEADLQEGETLRVEVNGEVMAIARHEGKYYAFNEFCTHRFGPLSEGPIAGGEVECPWHRSCFDIRTGKVTEGPAKIDLKTYEVSVREGKILVKPPEKAKAR